MVQNSTKYTGKYPEIFDEKHSFKSKVIKKIVVEKKSTLLGKNHNMKFVQVKLEA